MAALALAATPRTAEHARIRRASRAARAKVRTLDAEARRELVSMYRTAAEDIAARVRGYGVGDESITVAELRQLLDQVQGRLGVLTQSRDGALGGALSRSAQIGTDTFQLGAAASMKINEDALRFVRAFVAKDGLQLSDRIWRIDRQAREQVTNAIERAVIQGQGAAQAAAEFLRAGRPVPDDVLTKVSAGRASRVAVDAHNALVRGDDTALANAQRLFRTEINRAHGEAAMLAGADHPDFGGWRYLLSPAHPRPDICDLLSTQNLYGLGEGVYPNREKLPWPAHPNTLSFVEIVFADEITAADRAGKESPLAALARLTPGEQRGVLGAGKFELYKDGKISQGMIRTPLAAVRKRIGRDVRVIPPRRSAPAVPPVVPRPATPATLDEWIDSGAGITSSLLRRAARTREPLGEAFPAMLLERLHTERGIRAAATIATKGEGANLVRAASQKFPDAWTAQTDRFGPLYVRSAPARSFQFTVPAELNGQMIRVPTFGTVRARTNDGYLSVRAAAPALHEYVHRMQAAMPELDDLFQQLFERRTRGQPLQRLRDMTSVRFGANELARDDEFADKYFGKVYQGSGYGRAGALEVMTMGYEWLLGGVERNAAALIARDRELVHLLVGALFRYAP
jgi:hypothetical protein